MTEMPGICCVDRQDALTETMTGARGETAIVLGWDGAHYVQDTGDHIRFCPWSGTSLANRIAPDGLSFDILEFHSTSIMGDLQQASVAFTNGYEIRVNSDMASTGWEFSILKDDRLCGTLPHLDDREIYRAITEEEITELMQVVAELP